MESRIINILIIGQNNETEHFFDKFVNSRLKNKYFAEHTNTILIDDIKIVKGLATTKKVKDSDVIIYINPSDMQRSKCEALREANCPAFEVKWTDVSCEKFMETIKFVLNKKSKVVEKLWLIKDNKIDNKINYGNSKLCLFSCVSSDVIFEINGWQRALALEELNRYCYYPHGKAVYNTLPPMPKKKKKNMIIETYSMVKNSILRK